MAKQSCKFTYTLGIYGGRFYAMYILSQQKDNTPTFSAPAKGELSS